MTDNNIKYEAAVSQLEEIVRKMESGELDIDSLCDQLRKAKELLTLCREKLSRTDAGIKQLLSGDTEGENGGEH